MHKLKWLAVLVALLLLISSIQLNTILGKTEINKYAILVGIGHQYGNDLNGDKCAKLMLSVLRDAGFASKNIKVLTNKQATKQAFIDAIDWLKSVENAGSKIVVYIVCHGLAESICLYDTAVTHRWVRDLLSFKSHKQLVILDSCHSGGAVEPAEDGVTWAAPYRLLMSSASIELSTYTTAKYTRWSEAFILDGIKRGLADANEDGKVSMEEAFDYAKHHALSGGLISDNYGSDFFLGE